MFEIDRNILDKASKCKYGLSCLSENGSMDEVDQCINGEIIFVKGVMHAGCPYAAHFGHTFVCSCPVRKEIYKKYKK